MLDLIPDNILCFGKNMQIHELFENVHDYNILINVALSPTK